MSRRSLIAAVLMAGALALLWQYARGSRLVLYRGGPILTMDADNSVADAVVVEGDRIAAVGSAAALAGWVERGARVVDLGGRTMLPGFIDAHGHFPGAGLFAVMVELNSPPIGSIHRIDDIVARLRAKAADKAAGDWVVGMGYDDTLLDEKRHPTRGELDGASADHPIAILHVSGHLAVANSRALAEMGIDRDTADPEGGRIRRDPGSGELDGLLEESAAETLRARVLKPSPLDSVRIVREAVRLYLAAGVTTAQSGYTSLEVMRGLAILSRIGLVPLRVVIWPDEDAADAIAAGGTSLVSADDPWVRLGAVKLVADGSIQGYTAYLGEPYHVPPGDDPGYRGYPRMPAPELARRVSRFHARGLQVAVHGNGDAAIDDILDAFAAAEHASPRSDARHVVIHAQMARQDQLRRMRDLGVIPSFFSLHTYYWGDRHRDVFLGPERAARISPARSAADQGLRFTIHCDTPVVPIEPLRLVWAAVNRRSTSGAVIGETERIDAMQALRAVTIDAAFQHFEEAEKGSIEAGKLADLVILDRSPIADPEHIDQIRVLETIVGGLVVYAPVRSASSRPSSDGRRRAK